MADESLHEIFRALGRLEGKVDAFLTKQEDLDNKFKEHESRLNALEDKSKAVSASFTTVKTMWIFVAGIVGAFSDNILHWFTGK